MRQYHFWKKYVRKTPTAWMTWTSYLICTTSRVGELILLIWPIIAPKWTNIVWKPVALSVGCEDILCRQPLEENDSTRALRLHQHADIYRPIWRYCRCIVPAKLRRYISAMFAQKPLRYCSARSVRKPKLLLCLWLINANLCLVAYDAQPSYCIK